MFRPLDLLKFCLLSALLTLTMFAHGQNGSIKGQVIHKGAPLDFITIKLCDAQGKVLSGTLSDEFGNFEFKRLAPGSYSLVGEYENYSLQGRAIVGVDAQVVITLSPSIFKWIPQPKSNYVDHEVMYTLALLENSLGDAISIRVPHDHA